MTPADHYAEAERILERAADPEVLANAMREVGVNPSTTSYELAANVRALMLATAQVHATLATASLDPEDLA